MNASAKPRIGLIGCGRIGQIHLRSLLAMRDSCELAAIVDMYEPTVRDSAETYGIERWGTDVDDVMSDLSIDAVVIASSTETHGPFISAAARAGKAAFTEKPIALDLAATDAALADVRAAGTRLQIGFQRRFDRGYRAARDKIESGELGSIEFIRDAMRDPEPPTFAYAQRSGGLYRDMTIHNFDCVRWLMGADPVEVFAAGSVLVDPQIGSIGDIDTSVITMRFGNGQLATIENSRRSGFGYDVRTEVFGSNGAVFVGESRATPIRTFANGVHEDHQYFFLDRFGDAFRAEMQSFVNAIRNDTEVAVTGEDGRAALLLAYAAEASRAANAPVNLADVTSPTEMDSTHATA
jgi:myo-inositol 2-dehydrogenase/D-chiro-inositol 1-dehydrogenase